MRVTEFELERLDPDRSNPFDALNEAFVFGTDKNLKVEITVEDAIVRFGDQSHDVKQGDILMFQNPLLHFCVSKVGAPSFEFSLKIRFFHILFVGRFKGSIISKQFRGEPMRRKKKNKSQNVPAHSVASIARYAIASSCRRTTLAKHAFAPNADCF
jgi:hypothetical protein